MQSTTFEDEVDYQRAYYAKTADAYDAMHVLEDDEHSFALAYMIGAANYLGVGSILDIGSGTGRALLRIKEKMPNIRITGVEPSSELRTIGYTKGLSQSELVDGNAMHLDYADGSFDLVCEYGALHHIPKPGVAVSEMLRVAKKAIFISDCNNFGQGGTVSRFVKQMINACGLWPMTNHIKTGGMGYMISEGDGLAYSYSVFNDYAQISSHCKSVHVLNTSNSGPDLYKSAPHVAVLGIK